MQDRCLRFIKKIYCITKWPYILLYYKMGWKKDIFSTFKAILGRVLQFGDTFK